MRVESGIPYRDGRKDGRKPKYPWAEMQVGDSFFVDDVSANTMRHNAKYQSGKTGKTFKAAIEGDGVRVWRLA